MLTTKPHNERENTDSSLRADNDRAPRWYALAVKARHELAECGVRADLALITGEGHGIGPAAASVGLGFLQRLVGDRIAGCGGFGRCERDTSPGGDARGSICFDAMAIRRP